MQINRRIAALPRTVRVRRLFAGTYMYRPPKTPINSIRIGTSACSADGGFGNSARCVEPSVQESIDGASRHHLRSITPSSSSSAAAAAAAAAAARTDNNPFRAQRCHDSVARQAYHVTTTSLIFGGTTKDQNSPTRR